MTPPPSTEIGKNLKCRLFWYRCTPSDPCKSSTKILSLCYIVSISIIYQPYIYQILPISHQYIIKIKVIFQLFKFVKIPENSDLPPKSKLVYIWNVNYFNFDDDPPPPYWFFPQFGTFFLWLPLVCWYTRQEISCEKEFHGFIFVKSWLKIWRFFFLLTLLK